MTSEQSVLSTRIKTDDVLVVYNKKESRVGDLFKIIFDNYGHQLLEEEFYCFRSGNKTIYKNQENLLIENCHIHKHIGLIYSQKWLHKEIDNLEGEYENSKKYQIFLVTIEGTTICSNIYNSMRIGDFKMLICTKEHIHFDDLRFVYRGIPLNDNKIFDEYKIEENTHIFMLSRLRGGMFNKISGYNGNYEPLSALKILYINDE